MPDPFPQLPKIVSLGKFLVPTGFTAKPGGAVRPVMSFSFDHHECAVLLHFELGHVAGTLGPGKALFRIALLVGVGDEDVLAVSAENRTFGIVERA